MPHEASTSTYVTRAGTQLMLAGSPIQFIGFNAFGAACGCEGTPWTIEQMNDYFAALPAFGLTRTWAFPSTDLSTLDAFVSAAHEHHQHLVLTLDNDFDDCTSSGQKSANWYVSGYKSSYLTWVKTVAARYASSTAVALYECVNEAGQSRGDGVLVGSTMKAFYETTAAAIKSVDPHHLVGTGDSAEFLYRNGAADYQLAASGAHVDVLSLHDYESDYIDNAPVESTHFAPCHSAALALGKPILIGEMNDGLSHFADRTARCTSVVTSMRAYLSDGVAGALVWNRTYTDGSADPDYSIITGDPLIAAIGGWSPAPTARGDVSVL